MKISKQTFFLFLILLISAFLRFYKLDWADGYFFNPDERNMASAVSQMKLTDGFNPHFFAYGGFPLYLAYFSHQIFSVQCSVFSVQFAPVPFESAIFYLRFWSALAGVLTVLLVFLLSKELFQTEKFAYLAAILAAFTPGLVQSAHFGTTESLLTFFFLTIVYLSLSFLKTKKLKFLLFCAVASGLALGTKLSAALFLFPPLLVIILGSQKKAGPILKKTALFFLFSCLTAGAALLFFLLSSPYHFLNFPEAYRISLYEAKVATGEIPVFYTRQFIDTLPVIFQLTKIFPSALGWPIFILGSIGLLLIILNLLKVLRFPHKPPRMVARRDSSDPPAGEAGVKLAVIPPPSEESSRLAARQVGHLGGVSTIKAQNFSSFGIWILIISFLAYFLPNAFLFAKWTRFMTPIFPFFPIFAAYFLFLLSRLLRSNTFFLHCCIVAFSIVSFLPGLMFFSIYTREDVRLTASRFIYQNIPSGSHVLFDTGNVIDIPIPPISSNPSNPSNPSILDRVSFDFYGLDESPKLFENLLDELVKSDYIFVPSRRIFANHLRFPDKYPKTARYYELLFNGRLGFSKVAEFSSFPKLEIRNLKLEIVDEQSEETFTVFDHPVIRIYKKVRPFMRENYRKMFPLLNNS